MRMLSVRPSRRRAARGAALIEMLVAVAIVVLVGSVAVIGFGGGDRARLGAEAAEVARVLSEGRMRALETGRAQPIVLAEGALTVGPVVHAIDPGIAVTPEEAAFAISPTGASPGLELVLARADFETTVTLDWLTGRVDIR